MAKFASYPVLRTTNFARTVAFYEDLFGFTPFFEADGFVRLQDPSSGEIMMTIIDLNHQFLPTNLLDGKDGQIMSFVVEKFDEAYEHLYMEGLSIIKEPNHYGEGGRHFMAVDPNNPVVINIVAPESDRQKLNAECNERECVCC